MKFPKFTDLVPDTIGNYVRLTAESLLLGNGSDSDMWKTGHVYIYIFLVS